MRASLAIATAKLATWTARTAKLGAATTMPGKLARRIDPQILKRLSAGLRFGSILITGTNGKTTASTLFSLMAESSGWKVLHNRGGANLIDGLTSPFVQQATLGGGLSLDLAVMETDEATVPIACRELAPQGVVVTNFFRDQLDRFGELDKTVALVSSGIQALPSGRTVFLNADDPLVVSLQQRQDLNYVFYGLEEPQLAVKEMAQSAEARVCPRCGADLSYRFFYFAHHGDYCCPSCGFQRPKPQVYADRVKLNGLHGSELLIHTPKGDLRVEVKLPGMYNLYNILAATAAACSLDMPMTAIEQALTELPPAFGRMESLQAKGRQVYLALVKNPTGYNEVVRTFASDGHDLHMLFVLNDNIADGTDVSWIWDADFEILDQYRSRIKAITVAGLRAPELAVRLKYAGIPIGEEDICPKPSEAFERALQKVPEGGIMQVMPSYTAMLNLRQYLVEKGYLEQYWKE